MDPVATTRVTVRSRRTSTQKVRNPGQALLAIVKLVITKEDIEAGSRRKTLAGRRQHHPVRSNAGRGGKAGTICRHHLHLHARREITLPNTYPLRDDKDRQAHRVT